MFPVFVYVSENYKSVGKLAKVLNTLDLGVFYIPKSCEDLLVTCDRLGLTAKLIPEPKLYGVLRQMFYILVFNDHTDPAAVNYVRYALNKGKNFIVIPDEEIPYIEMCEK